MSEKKKILNEQFIYIENDPRYIGFYHNSDGSKVYITGIDEIRKINTDDAYFKDLLKIKGEAANFAYRYKIQWDFGGGEDSWSRFDWLCADAWYDLKNFFYIKDVPGFEGKTIAFQLRLSDHPMRPSVWAKKHVERKLFPKFSQERTNSQFCLNIMIDKKVNNWNFDDTYDKKTGIFVINVDLNESSKSAEQLQKIDEFFKAELSGSQPVLTYDELKFMFSNDLGGNDKDTSRMSYERFGTDDFHKVNFNKRDNINRDLKSKPNLNMNPLSTMSQTELFDYLDGSSEEVYINGKVYWQFKKDNFTYVYDGENLFRRKVKGGKETDNLVPVTLTENRIVHITSNDIIQMVYEAVNKIVKGLV